MKDIHVSITDRLKEENILFQECLKLGFDLLFIDVCSLINKNDFFNQNYDSYNKFLLAEYIYNKCGWKWEDIHEFHNKHIAATYYFEVLK